MNILKNMKKVVLVLLSIVFLYSCEKEKEDYIGTVTSSTSLDYDNGSNFSKDLTVFENDIPLKFKTTRKSIKKGEVILFKKVGSSNSKIKSIDLTFTDGKTSFSPKEFGTIKVKEKYAATIQVEFNGAKSTNDFTFDVVHPLSIATLKSVDSASSEVKMIKFTNGTKRLFKDLDDIDIAYKINKAGTYAKLDLQGKSFKKSLHEDNYKDSLEFTGEELKSKFGIDFKIGDTIKYAIVVKRGLVVDSIKSEFKITPIPITASKALKFSDKLYEIQLKDGTLDEAKHDVFYNLDSTKFYKAKGHIKLVGSDQLSTGDLTDQAVEFVKVKDAKSGKKLLDKGDYFKVSRYFEANSSTKVSSFTAKTDDFYVYKVANRKISKTKTKTFYGVIKVVKLETNTVTVDGKTTTVNNITISLREGYKI